MPFTDLKSLLPKRVKQMGIDRHIEASQIVDIANSVLNELFGADTTDYHAKAMSIRFQRLQIAAVNPAFRQELKQQEARFLSAVNQRLGKDLVTSIQLII